jgi:hypothetical protein
MEGVPGALNKHRSLHVRWLHLESGSLDFPFIGQNTLGDEQCPVIVLEKPRTKLILFSSAHRRILFISGEAYFRESLLYLTDRPKSTGRVL